VNLHSFGFLIVLLYEGKKFLAHVKWIVKKRFGTKPAND